MSRPDKWNEMVCSSKEQFENFNDFSEDKAIIWADNELNNYKRAMMALVNSNSNWEMSIADVEQCKFVNTMIRRAEEK